MTLPAYYSQYDIITPPAALAVSLATVKQHLKLSLTDTSQDTYLTLLISVATKVAEHIMTRTLINTGFRTYRPYFTDVIELRRSRLQSLDVFKYMVNGSYVDVTSSYYYTTNEIDFSKIILKPDLDYPTDIDDNYQAVKIEFVAGFGASDTAVPKDIQMALLDHIAMLYENRGDCDVDMISDPNTMFQEMLPKTSYMIYMLNQIKSVERQVEFAY